MIVRENRTDWKKYSFPRSTEKKILRNEISEIFEERDLQKPRFKRKRFKDISDINICLRILEKIAEESNYFIVTNNDFHYFDGRFQLLMEIAREKEIDVRYYQERYNLLMKKIEEKTGPLGYKPYTLEKTKKGYHKTVPDGEGVLPFEPKKIWVGYLMRGGFPFFDKQFLKKAEEEFHLKD